MYISRNRRRWGDRSQTNRRCGIEPDTGPQSGVIGHHKVPPHTSGHDAFPVPHPNVPEKYFKGSFLVVQTSEYEKILN